MGEAPSEIAIILTLTKFMEILEENEAKSRLMEAELEEKRREQERKHEERMTSMILGFMQQVMGSSTQLSAAPYYHAPFPPTSTPNSFYSFPTSSIPTPDADEYEESDY